MYDFVQAFEDRVKEIEAYLDLLDGLEKQVQEGTPHFGDEGPVITVQQQKILYSSVFLQLYNLVESTIRGCLDAVTEAISDAGHWQAGDLSHNLRREWVRVIAKTNERLNPEKRLEAALELCEILLQGGPVSEFVIEKRSNWDDEEIYKVSTRIGFSLDVSPSAISGIKQPFRNDLGALKYIRELRNRLAHGIQSFEETGADLTVGDLRDLKNKTTSYLREVALSFKHAIGSHEFLQPSSRP